VAEALALLEVQRSRQECFAGVDTKVQYRHPMVGGSSALLVASFPSKVS